MILNNCWISPQGDIIAVEWHEHGRAANKLLGTSLNSELAILTLARAGWLHIGLSEFVGFIAYNSLPDKQAESLYKVLDSVTSGIVEQNITSYIHS